MTYQTREKTKCSYIEIANTHIHKQIRQSIMRYTTKIEKKTGGKLQKQVLEILVKSGWLAVRVNTIRRGKYRSYKIANNKETSGFSDILALKNNKALLLEIKGAGDRQRKTQKEFETICSVTGNDYYIIETIEDIINILKNKL